LRRIAISYRRADSAPITGRICDELDRHFGEGDVFMDIDAIPFGVDFRDYIVDSLQSAVVVLVIIGPKWLGSRRRGQYRIQEVTDPVRLEVETALRLGIRIIPVLVERAVMPSPDDLPESLKSLSYINAGSIESGRDFRSQLDRVIRVLENVLATSVPSTADPVPEPLTESHAEEARVAPPGPVEQARVVEQPPVVVPRSVPAPLAAPPDSGEPTTAVLETRPVTEPPAPPVARAPKMGPARPVSRRLIATVIAIGIAVVLAVGIGNGIYSTFYAPYHDLTPFSTARSSGACVGTWQGAIAFTSIDRTATSDPRRSELFKALSDAARWGTLPKVAPGPALPGVAGTVYALRFEQIANSKITGKAPAGWDTDDNALAAFTNYVMAADVDSGAFWLSGVTSNDERRYGDPIARDIRQDWVIGFHRYAWCR
jgi:hypothetical protein